MWGHAGATRDLVKPLSYLCKKEYGCVWAWRGRVGPGLLAGGAHSWATGGELGRVEAKGPFEAKHEGGWDSRAR